MRKTKIMMIVSDARVNPMFPDRANVTLSAITSANAQPIMDMVDGTPRFVAGKISETDQPALEPGNPVADLSFVAFGQDQINMFKVGRVYRLMIEQVKRDVAAP